MVSRIVANEARRRPPLRRGADSESAVVRRWSPEGFANADRAELSPPVASNAVTGQARVIYVVLAHRDPEQLQRLTTLLASADSTSVLVHWDGDTRPDLPGDVGWLQRRSISWGRMGIPMVFLDGMRAASRMCDDGWVVFLSGQDYPLRPLREIHDELLSSSFDLHMDTRPVVDGDPWPLWEPLTRYGYRHVLTPRLPAPARRYLWRLVARSCARVQRLAEASSSPQPWDVRPRWVLRNIGAQLSVGLRRRRHPFEPPHALHAGDAWFSLRLTAAREILEALHRDPSYLRFMRHTLVPDECFFQSLAANHLGHLRVGPWRRHREFAAGESHPRVWTCADLPALQATGADYARKFDREVDGRVLDALDDVIGSA